jgi:hypothetical protein
MPKVIQPPSGGSCNLRSSDRDCRSPYRRPYRRLPRPLLFRPPPGRLGHRLLTHRLPAAAGRTPRRYLQRRGSTAARASAAIDARRPSCPAPVVPAAPSCLPPRRARGACRARHARQPATPVVPAAPVVPARPSCPRRPSCRRCPSRWRRPALHRRRPRAFSDAAHPATVAGRRQQDAQQTRVAVSIVPWGPRRGMGSVRPNLHPAVPSPYRTKVIGAAGSGMADRGRRRPPKPRYQRHPHLGIETVAYRDRCRAYRPAHAEFQLLIAVRRRARRFTVARHDCRRPAHVGHHSNGRAPCSVPVRTCSRCAPSTSTSASSRDRRLL